LLVLDSLGMLSTTKEIEYIGQVFW
jgi:hypothetical protein